MTENNAQKIELFESFFYFFSFDFLKIAGADAGAL